MTKKVIVVAHALLLSLGSSAEAHRLDEYLQATLISIEADLFQAQLRLTPGVAVSSAVLANIDTDSDAEISETEGRAYAEQVLHDLSLTVDGDVVSLQLSSVEFPPAKLITEGLGQIRLEFSGTLPPGPVKRTLVFENRHQRRIAEYLVNCLVPRDPTIRIVAQHRNEQQSLYQLDYTAERISTNL